MNEQIIKTRTILSYYLRHLRRRITQATNSITTKEITIMIITTRFALNNDGYFIHQS